MKNENMFEFYKREDPEDEANNLEQPDDLKLEKLHNEGTEYPDKISMVQGNIERTRTMKNEAIDEYGTEEAIEDGVDN